MSMTFSKNAALTNFRGMFILKNHPSDCLGSIHCKDCLIVEVTEPLMPDFQASSAIYLRTSAHGLNQICMGRGR